MVLWLVVDPAGVMCWGCSSYTPFRTPIFSRGRQSQATGFAALSVFCIWAIGCQGNEVVRSTLPLIAYSPYARPILKRFIARSPKGEEKKKAYMPFPLVRGAAARVVPQHCPILKPHS